MQKKVIRPIAFYLPQFYPTSDNDKWWGKGFTEWSLVAQAKPLFKDHYQPHIPSDLGFYDLRVPEIMEQQAKLAREAGIYGFMIYHYWFQGKRFLEMPVKNMIRTGQPSIPFSLCWANETWTKVWDGKPKEILQKQEYSPEDDEKHMTYLCREVFSNGNYIKIGGRPLFGIWERNELPDIKKTISVWRKIAREQGFPGLYLVSIDCLTKSCDPLKDDLDAVVEFVPDWHSLPAKRQRNFFHKILNFAGISRSPYYDHRIMEYDDLAESSMKKVKPSFRYFPGITPSWDNTSRRKNGNAHVFHGSSPEKFGRWLHGLIDDFTPYSEEENFIFINAWNEWAEGAHLEPCFRHGNGYLEAIKNVLKK